MAQAALDVRTPDGRLTAYAKLRARSELDPDFVEQLLGCEPAWLDAVSFPED